MDKWFHPIHYNGCDYLSMLGLKLNHVSKRGHRSQCVNSATDAATAGDKQRVFMHGHQGWNVRHGLCHIYIRYVYIYIWVVYSFCLFCCLFIIVRWWYVWCIEWASGNQEEVQARLVTLCLFIRSCYSLYKTTLGLLCSLFEKNPYFHKYSTDFYVQCVYLDKFFMRTMTEVTIPW